MPRALDRLVDGASILTQLLTFFRNDLEREVEQGKAIADSARRAGVSQFVFPSVALSEQAAAGDFSD